MLALENYYQKLDKSMPEHSPVELHNMSQPKEKIKVTLQITTETASTGTHRPTEAPAEYLWKASVICQA